MIHTNNPIIKHKADLLNLAEEFGNVSRAYKVMGVSRDTFYLYQQRVEDSKKLYSALKESQKDLDGWTEYYSDDRTHQSKMCCGRTPMETLLDGKSIWAEKNLAHIKTDKRRMKRVTVRSSLSYYTKYHISLHFRHAPSQ